MSLLTRLFDDGPDQLEERAPNFGIPKPSMNEEYWLGTGGGGAMALGAFYACVTLLADTIASLEVRAYKREGHAVVPVDPQPRLLNDSGPYPETTWFEWLWMTMESLAVTGNGIGYITARADNKPTAIMPVHPDVVNVTMDGGTKRWPEPVYRIGGEKVRNEDIVHIKRYPIAGAARGMSVIEKAAAAVGLGLAAERYGLNYFRDSASPSSVLETDQTLDDTAAKGVMQRWVASHGGRRRPAILSGGLKWKPISITPNESQFLQTRQFQRGEIAMWFRIPPHMIGDTQKSTTWGSGIENMTLGFVKFTLKPWLTCIEQVLTNQLPRGTFARFDLDGLLRGDILTRWETYRIGRDAGVYSVNDINEMEHRPPIGPEGDTRIQPANFVPLGWQPPDPTVSGGDDNDSDVPPPSDTPANAYDYGYQPKPRKEDAPEEDATDE